MIKLPKVTKSTASAPQTLEFEKFFERLSELCLEEFGDGNFHLNLIATPKNTSEVIGCEWYYSAEQLQNLDRKLKGVQGALRLFSYTGFEASTQRVDSLWTVEGYVARAEELFGKGVLTSAK